MKMLFNSQLSTASLCEVLANVQVATTLHTDTFHFSSQRTSKLCETASTASTTPGPPTGSQSRPGAVHLTVPLQMYSFLSLMATVDTMRFFPRVVSTWR